MWDKRYSAEHYIYGTEPNQFLRNNISSIPVGKVLCLAEGEGRNAVYLARQGYTVTAVDASIVGLEKAKQLADKHKVSVEFIHSQLEDSDIGVNKWNGIVSIFCHLPSHIRKDLHSKVVTGLKENGVLLLESYTPDQLKLCTGGPPSAELMMSSRILKEELEGLSFRHLQELEREVLEGSHHTGMGAVVQAIAVHP